MSPVKIAFTKPALAAEQHVSLLRERGMIVPDEARAVHYINFLGYYRLSGYFRSLRSTPDSERFRPGTNFDDVLNVYVFDRKLRVLLADALERIEVAVKATMANAGAMFAGPFWMVDGANFDRGQHDRAMKEVEEITRKSDGGSQHIFINHFYKTYSDAVPPCWMLIEAMSFGAVSRIYKITKGTIRRSIAEAFNLQQDILESWLHALVFARNLCAHSCRMWNRTFTIRPKIPRQYADDIPLEGHARLYALCCIMQHMMMVIADGSQWADRLREHVSAAPISPQLSMGFPNEWWLRQPWFG